MPFKHNAFILINFIIEKLHMIHVWTFILFISKSVQRYNFVLNVSILNIFKYTINTF